VVSEQAKVSRQALSRNYKHLYPFITGQADFEDSELPKEARLEREVRELNAKLLNLENQNIKALKEAKQGMLTQLMILDLKSFETQATDVTLNKLQIQNDELISRSKDYLRQIASLRADSVDLKRQSAVCISSEVLAHFVAVYDAIEPGMGDMDALKLFVKAERRNMDAAIEACITLKPDAILFFQPFLSCSIDILDIKVAGSRVVILESNCFLKREYDELIKSLPSIKIHAVSAKNIGLKIAKFYCRSKYQNCFNETFLKKLYDKVCYPFLDDGFASVSVFSPKQYLKVVENSED